MSVVVVRKTDKKIKIAADSIVVAGYTQLEKTLKCSKLFKVNDMIVGGVGSAAENLLLENFCLTHKPNAPTEREILNFFVEFNTYLTDLGLSKYTNDFLVCFAGKVFHAAQNLFVAEVQDYAAIGAGQDYSLAALYLGHSVKEAVETSCHLCTFVSSPIVEYEMKLEENE